MSESDTTKKQEPVEKKPVKKEPAKKEVVKEEVPVEAVTEDDVVETEASIAEGNAKEETEKADAAEKEKEEEQKQKKLKRFENVIVVPITAYEEMTDAAVNLVEHPILSDSFAENFSPNKTMVALTHAFRFFSDKEAKRESDLGEPLKISPNTTTDVASGTIRGMSAKRILSAAKGGTYRLKLPSSGFYMLLRKPSLEFLNTLFESLDIMMEELGKIIGDYRHTFRAAIFYQTVMDNLPRLVTYANIENWQEEGVLEENIKYSDLPAIVWTICILAGLRDYMYVNVCPKCGERTEIKGLDILSMMILSKKFNPDAIELLSSSEVKSIKDLQEYKKLIAITDTVVSDDVTYDFEEPSVAKWLSAANVHMELIRRAVDGKPSKYKRDAFNKSAMLMHHGMAPWITGFSLKSVDGKSLRFEGAVAINQQLDDLITEPNWEKFSNDAVTKIASFEQYTIGHAPQPCGNTECNYMDKDIEFITWDPNMTFLVTTYQRLAIAGLKLTDQTSVDD